MKNKKISTVKGPRGATGVEGADAVSGVGEVKGATAVGAVRGAGSIHAKRRATRTMTLEEREQLFKLLNEEAEKLVNQGAIPAGNKDVIKSAVMMAVDAGLLIEDEKEAKKPVKD